MTQDQILIGIAVGIFLNVLVQFFRMMKSPRDVSDEIAEDLKTVSKDHEALARRFERHDEVVKNLIEALNRLTQRIDRLEPSLRPGNGNKRGG